MTVERYDEIFQRERQSEYPAVDRFVERMGTTPLDRSRLESAARVLACPVKEHAPNWQHGRVVYAVASRVLQTVPGPMLFLDIGTAKGFSALCLQWALGDAGRAGRVVSLDVVDPSARLLRNTVAEVDGPLTLDETLEPWPETKDIVFLRCASLDYLREARDRVNAAFVDGKHEGEVVMKEGTSLSRLQKPGDAVVFDDVHLPSVCQAVESLAGSYLLEWVDVLPERRYAVGWRR